MSTGEVVNPKPSEKKYSLKICGGVQIVVDEKCAQGFYDLKEGLVRAGSEVVNDDPLPLLLYYVVRHGRVDVLKSVVEKCPVVNKMLDTGFTYENRFTSSGTVLHMAVAVGNLEAVKLLLDGGADANITAVDEFARETPLHVSAQVQELKLKSREKVRYKNIIGLLLERGADVFFQNGLFKPPLSMFLDSERWNAIEECIRAGVDVNRRWRCDRVVNESETKEGLSLFFLLVTRTLPPFRKPTFDTFMSGSEMSVELRNTAIRNLVSLCLDFGADCTNPFPLRSAVENEEVHLTRQFLKHTPESAATSYIDDSKHKKPFHEQWPNLHPLKQGFHKICRFNLNKQIKNIFDIELLLMKSIGKRDLEGVTKALKSGALQTGSIAGARYPLHFASSLGNSQVVDVLLSFKSPPNVLDSRGLSPLHYAALEGSQEMCKSLLRHGAAFNYPNPKGQSPSEIAEELSATSAKHKDVVEVLQDVRVFFKMLKTSGEKVLEELEKKTGSEDFWCFVNCINEKGNTLMGEALLLGREDVAKKVMFLKDKAAMTPSHK